MPNISINDILEVEEHFEDLQDSILEKVNNVETASDDEIDEKEEFDEDMLDDELEENELDEEDKTTEMYKLLHSNARILGISTNK